MTRHGIGVARAVVAALVMLLAACGSSPTALPNGSSASTSAVPTSLAPATSAPAPLAPLPTASTSPPAPTTTAPVATTTSTTRPPQSVAVVDDGHTDARTVNARPGDSIAITFAECAASCGYQWQVDQPPSVTIIKPTGDTTTPAPTSPHQVGGSGTHTFHFVAVAAGQTDAAIAYHPPGTGRPPDRTVHLHFVVGS